MESSEAVQRLSALAQDSRLLAFRTLVQAGAAGLPAGELARAVGVAPNTLSAQLTILANAGLVRSRRDGRSIIYSADYAATSELLLFLMEDCCAGRPEVCAPLAAAASRGACVPAQGAWS